ncbi:MAG: hypothetical protein GC190_09580 [Alphaproteobacteria bacterium]|nr:hypothetical protein [Alphaproteobacteria bacterium]
MRLSNVDNWGLAATTLFSLVVVVAFQHGRALDITTPAHAAVASTEPTVPTFVMTVTAKRLPPECKGIIAGSNLAYCNNLIDAPPVVVMRAMTAQYADLDQMLNADSRVETAAIGEATASR